MYSTNEYADENPSWMYDEPQQPAQQQSAEQQPVQPAPQPVNQNTGAVDGAGDEAAMPDWMRGEPLRTDSETLGATAPQAPERTFDWENAAGASQGVFGGSNDPDWMRPGQSGSRLDQQRDADESQLEFGTHDPNANARAQAMAEERFDGEPEGSRQGLRTSLLTSRSKRRQRRQQRDNAATGRGTGACCKHPCKAAGIIFTAVAKVVSLSLLILTLAQQGINSPNVADSGAQTCPDTCLHGGSSAYQAAHCAFQLQYTTASHKRVCGPKSCFGAGGTVPEGLSFPLSFRCSSFPSGAGYFDCPWAGPNNHWRLISSGAGFAGGLLYCLFFWKCACCLSCGNYIVILLTLVHGLFGLLPMSLDVDAYRHGASQCSDGVPLVTAANAKATLACSVGGMHGDIECTMGKYLAVCLLGAAASTCWLLASFCLWRSTIKAGSKE